jgi:hypothetical protein
VNPGTDSEEVWPELAPSKPELRIPASEGDIVDRKGDDQHDEGTEPRRQDYVEVTQVVDLVAAPAADFTQGFLRTLSCGPTFRRMSRFSWISKVSLRD